MYLWTDAINSLSLLACISILMFFSIIRAHPSWMLFCNRDTVMSRSLAFCWTSSCWAHTIVPSVVTRSAQWFVQTVYDKHCQWVLLLMAKCIYQPIHHCKQCISILIFIFYIHYSNKYTRSTVYTRSIQVITHVETNYWNHQTCMYIYLYMWVPLCVCERERARERERETDRQTETICV